MSIRRAAGTTSEIVQPVPAILSKGRAEMILSTSSWPRGGTLLGTAEAVQQLLLIVIPALILILIHSGSAKER